MIVVYPLSVQHDYTELKYSLRSIDKYLHTDLVIIAGERLPPWINNVTWLKISDYRGRKQLSIKTKIAAAIEIYGPCLAMADDVYLLAQNDFPYYYHGSLLTYPESGAKPLRKQLLEMGKGDKNFNTHYPIFYDKAFSSIMAKFTEECIIKSAFCNYREIQGQEITDCKIMKEISQKEIYTFIANRPCFSTGVQSASCAIPVLEQLFPDKSIYEGLGYNSV